MKSHHEYMATKAIWLGITAGVFFAGLGTGYAVFVSPNITMTPQQMQQMMNNPTMMEQWHQIMMNDPTHMQQMHQMMSDNPQHMQKMVQMMGPGMMNVMMNDPQLRQQMYDAMLGHQQFMSEMMNNAQFQQRWMGSMGSNMMNQDMMGQGMGPMGGMMGSPITNDGDVLKTIVNIEDLLDQVSSAYGDGDAKKALSLATTAYLENYEYIEGKLASYDPQLMEKVELMLRKDLRQMINSGDSTNDIDAHITAIKKELEKAKQFFQ